MNREKVKQLVALSFDKKLVDEVNYFIDTYNCDSADALDYAHDFAIEYNEITLLKAIRLILIEAGYYVEQPVKPQSCRDTRITVNKVKYDCVGGWDGWIDE